MDDNQPKGIGFYNIKSGETHYARLEAQIQAYINSSDMGINASRDQDFGWRLEPNWVKAVKAFRRDESRMRDLLARTGGQKVTTVNILYAIYGEQLRVAQEQAEENEAPFEQEYLQNIADKPAPTVSAPAQLPVEEDTIPEDVDEADLVPAPEEAVSGQVEEVPTADGKKPTKPATAKQK